MTKVTMVRVARDKRRHFLRRIGALVSRAVEKKLRVSVVVADEKRGEQFRQQLWTYDEGSFLPSGFVPGDANALDPVVIFINSIPPDESDIILNFAPAAIRVNWREAGAQWVYDFVNPDTDEGREVARLKWNAYKLEGVELSHAEEL